MAMQARSEMEDGSECWIIGFVDCWIYEQTPRTQAGRSGLDFWVNGFPLRLFPTPVRAEIVRL